MLDHLAPVSFISFVLFYIPMSIRKYYEKNKKAKSFSDKYEGTTKMIQYLWNPNVFSLTG